MRKGCAGHITAIYQETASQTAFRSAAGWVAAARTIARMCPLNATGTAGSGSGAVGNPLGYNRMYVHVAGEFNYEKWWEALGQGRVAVTNGPLIRPNVEGEMPATSFGPTPDSRSNWKSG